MGLRLELSAETETGSDPAGALSSLARPGPGVDNGRMAKSRDEDRVRRLPVGERQADAPRSGRVPRGRIEWVTTFLEMTRPPGRPALHRGGKLTLLRAERSTASFYRYLYNTVGGPWLWHERRCWSDDELIAVIHSAEVEIHVLYVAGVPAGFAELDRRRKDEVELVYLGVIPEFSGRGLGTYLLGWTVDQAWSKPTRRLWVCMSNHDHPAALAAFQRAGFEPYDQESAIIDDPRRRGAMPRGQEFS